MTDQRKFKVSCNGMIVFVCDRRVHAEDWVRNQRVMAKQEGLDFFDYIIFEVPEHEIQNSSRYGRSDS